MFENPFKKQIPKPVQETTPANEMETIQDFFVGRLENMKPLFEKLESLFDKSGENFENLKFSAELASRAKIVLPVFMTVLATFGNVEQSSAQVVNQAQGMQNGQMVNNPGNQNTVQMTPEQWAAYEQQQKDLKTAQNLKIAGGVTMAVGTVLQGVGAMSNDVKTQNALLISGAVLNVAGTGMVIGGNVKAGQAGGTVSSGAQQQGRGYRPWRQ